jgi:nucleotide-binding universal stress UspA family protein
LRILLAVDDDRPSLLAAIAVARWFPADAEVVALHVATDPGPIVPVVPGAAPAGYVSATLGELDDAAFASIARDLALRAASLTDGEPRVEHGDTVATICRVAEEMAADLIVVGTGDRGFLSRLVHPSIGTDVVTEAPCSVLVVRTPRGEHAADTEAAAVTTSTDEGATLMSDAPDHSSSDDPAVSAVSSASSVSSGPQGQGAMETEVDALRRFRAEGYERSFAVEPLGRIGDGDVSFDAAEAKVHAVARFEGMSNPDDESMLLALEGPGGERGTFAVPYGPSAGADDLAVIRRLDLHGRHEH